MSESRFAGQYHLANPFIQTILIQTISTNGEIVYDPLSGEE